MLESPFILEAKARIRSMTQTSGDHILDKLINKSCDKRVTWWKLDEFATIVPNQVNLPRF